MAYLEVISSSGFEKPLKTTEKSYISFSWLVALPIAFLYATLSFWKAEEIPLLKALSWDLLPETVEHLSSWLTTPPFLFLILNLMIMAILVSSGLFSDSSTAASDSSDIVPAANYRVGSSLEDHEDVSSLETAQASLTSTAIVLREEFSTNVVDTPLPSVSTTDRIDIVKADELELTSGIEEFELHGERNYFSGLNDSKQTIERMELNEFALGERLDEAKSSGSVKTKILDDELKSSRCTIFDVADSPLLNNKPRATKFRSSGSKKLETLCNDCKASPSPIKGRVSLDLDDLHERIEAFINKAREQMRQQEQVASTIYSRRYVGSDHGW
ncbi:hypothetical protein O6H91_05G025000 [Diphasiastrum complanatum]|uniref:Uncharacterized protein n=1 Tax=Diphasiastrum complanatum TaxID=34168 RepID=A0ACC2DLX8_DIPCM|nr:hypothetical protein O6H91_05G025000 [Diphasiastrum complanatum]